MRHHGVHNKVIDGDLRKLATHLMANVNKHAVRNAQHIGFVHNGHVFFSGHGQLKSRSGNPLAAQPRDAPERHHHIGRDQHFATAGFHIAVSVKALGVLAHHHQVKLAEPNRQTGVSACGANIGKQVQVLAKKLGGVDFSSRFVLELVCGHGAQHQPISCLHFGQKLWGHGGTILFKAFMASHIVV